MKKKTKLALEIIVTIIVCVILIYVLWARGIIRTPNFIGKILEGETDLERIERVLETTYPTDIFVLGEEIWFEMDIDNTVIEELADESIESDKDYVVLIINDLEDKVELSEEEIKVANEFIQKEGNLLLYFGEKYATTWNYEGKPLVNIEGNLCYEYYILDGYGRRGVGGWSEEDQDMADEYPAMLGKSVMYRIDDYLQEIN